MAFLTTIELSSEYRQLRSEARAYFSGLMTPELESALRREDESLEKGDPQTSVRRQVGREIGAAGWIAIGVPERFGGTPGNAMSRVIVAQEAERAGAPFPFLTTLSIMPAVIAFGSEDLRQTLVTPMARGEVLIALGYTEPDAGTDLASLRTRAEPTNDGFIVNGSKVFTSEADIADYVLLAARTDPEAPKTRGISIFVVPTSAPGFSCTALPTMGDYRTTTTFYDDVVVPSSHILGTLDDGWSIIVSQLNLERTAMAVRIGAGNAFVDEVYRDLEATTDASGASLLSRATVRRSLARAAVEEFGLEALIAFKVGDGVQGDAVAASELKIFASESAIRTTRALLDAYGSRGALTADSESAPLRGALERAYRRATIDTFGGGTNEIQRQLIATRGLGLPRSS